MKSFYNWLLESENPKYHIDKITPEMEDSFKSYLSNHVNMVRSNVKRLYDRGLITGELSKLIRDTHDKSKLEEPEYTPYVKRKWFEKAANKDLYDDMDDDIKAAIVHHVTHNSHHPEYWSNDYRGFETSDPCHVNDMPEDCVVEMICDWKAMSEERGNTPRDWYNKTKDTRWIFDDKTNMLINKWLKIFEELQNEK